MTQQQQQIPDGMKEVLENFGVRTFTKAELKCHDAEVKTATLLWHGVGLAVNAAAITWWRRRKAARRG